MKILLPTPTACVHPCLTPNTICTQVTRQPRDHFPQPASASLTSSISPDRSFATSRRFLALTIVPPPRPPFPPHRSIQHTPFLLRPTHNTDVVSKLVKHKKTRTTPFPSTMNPPPPCTITCYALQKLMHSRGEACLGPTPIQQPDRRPDAPCVQDEKLNETKQNKTKRGGWCRLDDDTAALVPLPAGAQIPQPRGR